MFPMTAAAASHHLRSRGYDCRPAILDALIRQGVVTPAQPDDGSDAVEVEDAYRDGFFKDAEAAYAWKQPDREAVERAFEKRREAKQLATIKLVEDGAPRYLYRVGRVEAARLLGVSPGTVDNLRRRGELPSVRVGARRHFAQGLSKL
ncbi:MAG: hypothetical protein C0511_18190 [Hyphomicrobium sp.]|nr:hypothetical protein [Planctomyces sp.]MBA4174523.1 hypothetical protein [Hyphomicrobium sp.]